MKTLGNIIWHIPFLGFIFALLYAIGGLLSCITVIGIPIGLGLLQFSQFLLSPFSKAIITRKDFEMINGEKQGDFMKGFSFIVRILYFPFGLIAAIGAICTIVAEFISIIGIPSGLVWAKSLSTIFNPINKICVPKAVADQIETIKNRQTVDQYSNEQVNTNSLSDEIIPPHNAPTQVMMEKAEGKTDEELKEIIRMKEDYNPALVQAAETVLLSRSRWMPVDNAASTNNPIAPMTSIEYSTASSQVQPSVNTIYFAGAKMVLISMAMSFLVSIIDGIRFIFPPFSIIHDAIINCISFIMGILLIVGSLKMLSSRKNKPHVGSNLILTAGILFIISTISYFYSSYLNSQVWDAFTSCEVSMTDLFTRMNIFSSIGSIFYFFYSIAFIAGIIKWQKECINKDIAKQGTLFIAVAMGVFVVILVLAIFGIYIVRQDNYNIIINFLISIYPLILSSFICVGVYKIAVGLGLIKSSNSINL